MNAAILLAVPLALLLLAAPAQAGSPGRHGGPHDFDAAKRVERMTEELELTADQSEQLLAVFEAAEEEREALRQRIEEQFGPEMCAQHLATVEQVREVLTDEQEAEFEGRLERMAGFAEGKGRRGPKAAFLENCQPKD